MPKKNPKNRQRAPKVLQKRPRFREDDFAYSPPHDVLTRMRPGVPREMRLKLRCNYVVGGSGAAVGIITNNMTLNSLAGGSYTYISEQTILSLYNRFRVVGVDMWGTVTTKFTAPVVVGIFPTPDTTTSITTLQDLYNNVALNTNALILTVGAAGGGNSYTKIPPVHWNFAEIFGDTAYLTDNDYASTGAAPLNLLKLFITTAPTGGAAFTAATDPVCVLFFDVTVQCSEPVSV